MVSQKGPWKDFELVKPVGIRKKQAAGEITEGVSNLKIEEKKVEETVQEAAKYAE